MGRRTFDRLVSTAALLIALVMLIGGALLMWAANFANGNVADQLKAQNITMPAGPAIDSLEQADKDQMSKFAEDGKNLMDNGDEAKAYADHYILAHMNHGTVSLYSNEADETGKTPYEGDSLYKRLGIPEGTARTYADLGADVKKKDADGNPILDPADKNDASIIEQMNAERDSLFRGSSLRGLLLEAYAFGTMGKIAQYASWALFLLGIPLLILSILGFLHSNKASDEPKRVVRRDTTPTTTVVTEEGGATRA